MSYRDRPAATLTLKQTSGEMPHLGTAESDERALTELSHEMAECLTALNYLTTYRVSSTRSAT
jgi:hypothetical protein